MIEIDLAGEWAFALDPDDRGEAEGWQRRQLAGRITLPGSLQAQGLGAEVSVDTPWIGSIVDSSWYHEARYAPYRQPGNVKVPFWLQPERHYLGPAWYQRTVHVPPEWAGQHVVLTLERPHWETRLWLDTAFAGRDDSLSTPHVYDLGSLATGEHRLTLRVNNRPLVEVGPNAHSVSDHTQTAWNGVVGQITLAARSPVWVGQIDVYPNVARRAAQVRIRLNSVIGRASQVRLTVRATLREADEQPQPVSVELSLGADGATVELDYPLGAAARLWDEFQPALYHLDVELAAIDGVSYGDSRRTTFGLREISVQGTQLALNGRPIFLRGTLECCIFPLTGYPPTDVESWRRIVAICKAHGLNHIRFHSWCPPEAAFAAADELGFYYQVECAAWANQGAALGLGAPVDDWLYAEGRRIVASYGNHPSFLLMAYGNEPAGQHEAYLARWVAHWKRADPRRLYTSAAGWPALPENDYHNVHEPRIHQWGDELGSRINGLPPETCSDYRDWVARLSKPIVSHEIGQWCAYPNFAEIAKYTGVLKARNFEIFRDRLAANHMGDQAQAFLIASGKLQALCYKEEIEAALRTPGFGGFQLLDLHDFPGQGTALVGVLDAFWDEKGYITAEEYRRFCNSTVPLARLAKRYWHSGEQLNATLEVAHFGPEPLAEASMRWRLVDAEGSVWADGALGPIEIAIGNGQQLGSIEVELSEIPLARKYSLVAEIEGTPFVNDWDIWVFAERLDTVPPAGVKIAERLDEEALDHLSAGGKLLLMPLASTIRTESILGFSSVFWNTAWTRGEGTGQVWPAGQAPHTLGILCDPDHPALAQFPTEAHSNWQWWELIHGAAAMVLDRLPPGLRPIVQPIDTWFENRRLGLLFEARVGGGSLLMCSMDLCSALDRRLVARQLRHSFLWYMGSAQFAPRQELSVADIHRLLMERGPHHSEAE